MIKKKIKPHPGSYINLKRLGMSQSQKAVFPIFKQTQLRSSQKVLVAEMISERMKTAHGQSEPTTPRSPKLATGRGKADRPPRPESIIEEQNKTASSMSMMKKAAIIRRSYDKATKLLSNPLSSLESSYAEKRQKSLEKGETLNKAVEIIKVKKNRSKPKIIEVNDVDERFHKESVDSESSDYSKGKTETPQFCTGLRMSNASAQKP